MIFAAARTTWKQFTSGWIGEDNLSHADAARDGGRRVVRERKLMRQCPIRQPGPSSITQNPCLLGVGQELEKTYDDLLRDSLPDDWKRLVARLAERVDANERRRKD